MTLIQSIQQWLKGYSGMELKQIKTDSTDNTAGSYALAPAGNNKIYSDILGNTTYENNYVFYAKETAADEVDRRQNYDFLEGFSNWIDEQNAAHNMPTLPGTYTTESIEVANIMLFDVDESGLGTYQIQIKVTMTKRRV